MGAVLPLIHGAPAPPAITVTASPREVRTGEKFTIKVASDHKIKNLSYSICDRTGGTGSGHFGDIRAPGEVETSLDWGLPGWYEVRIEHNDDVHILASDYVKLLPAVEVDIAAPPGKFGYAVGEDVVLDVKLKNATDRAIADAKVVLAMQDVDGRTHHLEQRTVSLQPGAEQAQQFKWTMPDLGPQAWFFWAIAECRAGKTGRGRAEMPIHRFKKYSVREDWQWSTWTNLSRFPQTVVPDVLELFEDAGYNALGCVTGTGDHPWCYRRGLRTYVEMPNFGGIDNIGWPGENFEEFMAQQARTRWPHVTQSSVAAICSYGEEPGFGPAFGTTWHWGDGPAPDPANLWFRKYLRQLYTDSIEKLNAQWGTAFKSFDEIQLDLEFGGSGRRGYADVERMGPITPERNLSRYVDCHSFYHWYFHKWNHEAAKQVAALNPTATPVMSMDNEFMTQLDLVGMYVHWMYPKEWMAGYNAYQRQFAADPAGFIMNWGFFDDPRINNQIYLLSLMQGAIPMSFWYDFPLQFNYDLTHSRASLQFRELRRRLEPKLGAILHPVPKVDKEIGIYLPLLDWKASMGRPVFMLGLREDNKNVPWMAGVGGYEQPIHSALCENGYAPRFVSRRDFPECKLIFVPYAQSVPPEDAQALKDAVQNGAVVVATPKLATHDVHGKPLDRTPGEGLGELFGITAEPTITSCYNLLGTSPVNAWEKDAVIGFPPGVYHPGGDPLRLQSFGYQKIAAVAPDAKVQARYPDGTPAIILRQSGKGAAIYLNVCYHWSEEWYTQFSEHREAFRIFLNEIVKYAKIEPAP
ncbi:MAG TPA: beta-galactosidase trimerization domain-containing protein, partial [Phycisphaerae bacterium]|nr:beta-galactosidase trimerization domain-containing protein [Phycisphaerae bacterium]